MLRTKHRIHFSNLMRRSPCFKRLCEAKLTYFYCSFILNGQVCELRIKIRLSASKQVLTFPPKCDRVFRLTLCHNAVLMESSPNVSMRPLSLLVLVSSSLPVQQQPQEAPGPKHFQPLLLLLPQLQRLPCGAATLQQQDPLSAPAARGERQSSQGVAHFSLTSHLARGQITYHLPYVTEKKK